MGKPTINDVARLSGVSKKTVSRVINNSPLLGAETRARVEAVIAQLGYVPNPQARALALRRNFLIAMIHDGGDDPDLLLAQQGVLDAIGTSDFALVIQRIVRGGDVLANGQLRSFLERHRPAGAIMLPSLAEDASLAAVCHEFGTPLIQLCAGPLPDAESCLVSLDREATAEAVHTLHRIGHRRIALLAGPEGSQVAQQRELGYIDAIAELGLDRGPALVAASSYCDVEEVHSAELLLDVSPGPSAIIATSPSLTAAAFRAAYRRGLAVPGELSVIGFVADKHALAHWPPLSNIDVPVREMARWAAGRLCGLNADDPVPAPFRPRLTLRASTAPRAAA